MKLTTIHQSVKMELVTSPPMPVTKYITSRVHTNVHKYNTCLILIIINNCEYNIGIQAVLVQKLYDVNTTLYRLINQRTLDAQ